MSQVFSEDCILHHAAFYRPSSKQNRRQWTPLHLCWACQRSSVAVSPSLQLVLELSKVTTWLVWKVCCLVRRSWRQRLQWLCNGCCNTQRSATSLVTSPNHTLLSLLWGLATPIMEQRNMHGAALHGAAQNASGQHQTLSCLLVVCLSGASDGHIYPDG